MAPNSQWMKEPELDAAYLPSILRILLVASPAALEAQMFTRQLASDDWAR